MEAVSGATETEIWSRIIRPEQGGLSPEGARDFLRLSISEADRVRAAKLSPKANAVNAALQEPVRSLARKRCEYSHFPEEFAELSP